tara:strand:- start:6796 stop:7047 length:252 start_codon:yes stop_codon:yes gene_type:complete
MAKANEWLDYEPSMVLTEDFAGEEFKELVGYTVELEVEGDHRNDGQLVDYEFTFISPNKKKTRVSTEMALMVGFNYHEPVTIK